jgi:hypothetical protein
MQALPIDAYTFQTDAFLPVSNQEDLLIQARNFLAKR